MKQRRDEWILANGPCAQCGSWDNLEVDHKNPEEKSYNPALLWSRNKEFRDRELTKCQVLCKDCHLEKTAKYQEDNRKHGTLNTYKYHACRCNACKKSAIIA